MGYLQAAHHQSAWAIEQTARNPPAALTSAAAVFRLEGRPFHLQTQDHSQETVSGLCL